jgi:Resolvase, N terminal domain
VPDALDILGQLSVRRGVRVALGGSVYDWNDPFARMFLQILAVIAEFEANLIRQLTREGMAIARQNGRLRGKQPSLSAAQDREIRRMHDSGDYNIAEIAVLFSASRPTVYGPWSAPPRFPRPPPILGPRPTSPGTTSCSPAALTEKGGPVSCRAGQAKSPGCGHRATSTLDGDGTPGPAS